MWERRGRARMKRRKDVRRANHHDHDHDLGALLTNSTGRIWNIRSNGN